MKPSPLLLVLLLFLAHLSFAQDQNAYRELEKIEEEWNKITIDEVTIDPVHIDKIDWIKNKKTSSQKPNKPTEIVVDNVVPIKKGNKSPKEKIERDNIIPPKKSDQPKEKIEINPRPNDKKNEQKTEEIDEQSAIPSRYPLPKNGTAITSNFGYRVHPRYKVKRFHNGVDISAPKGTKVYSTAKGKILSAGRVNGYGKYIVIKHNRHYKTAYAHLDKIVVKKGRKVKLGEIIGRVGNTGMATGNHLHYEVIKGNKKVNPRKYW